MFLKIRMQHGVSYGRKTAGNGHKAQRHINYYRGVGTYTMYYANITVALTNVCKIKI